MRIGIIGCGQLARMLALAGVDMGLSFSFLARQGEATRPVRGLGRIVRWRDTDNAGEIHAAMGKPDVITVEREDVDADLLRSLSALCRVHPNHDAVHSCGDRLLEHRLLSSLDIPTAPHFAAHTALQVTDAAQKLGLPVIVKASRAGYDGKNQWRIHNAQDLHNFCRDHTSGDWLVESKVIFQREISIIAARSARGEVVLYPPTENRHHEGILLTSIAPADKLPPDFTAQGYEYIQRLLEAMDYVGVLAMECFVTEEGLMVNELAPRVHNSGHWTLRSKATSQFENHLRAILGMRLGSTQLTGYDGMINILGPYDRSHALQALSSASTLTDYNKSFGPLRKLGHINVSGSRREDIVEELGRLQYWLYSRDERTDNLAGNIRQPLTALRPG